MAELAPTTRFSNRVQDYILYRPHYPEAAIEYIVRALGLNAGSVLCDIGSGTGISAEPFLERGIGVIGVEPNREMRLAAEEYLKLLPNFRSVDGTAEATTLPDASVDHVLAAQAFHWFRPSETRRELRRILKPSGQCVLLWN